MPRLNSTTWAAGETVSAARLQAFNTDIDDLYSKGDDRLKVYKLTTDPALMVRIGAGNWRVGSAEGQYAGWTFTVWATATTYIMIDSSGAIQTSTSTWNGDYGRLGVVVSSAGVITSVTQWRMDAVGGLLWAAGFSNITSMTYGRLGLLTSLVSDGVTYTLTWSGRRIKTLTNGTNTWTPTWSANGKLASVAKT